MDNRNNIIYYIIIFSIIYIIYRKATYTTEKYDYDYIRKNYISSKNFLYECDHHTTIKELPLTYPKSYGETIYINTKILPQFVTNYLPKIKYKFILVTGDSIETIPDSFHDETNIILNNRYLLKWFAQNSKISNNIIIQLPLGLDYHTSTKIAKWGKIQTVQEQINDINNIKSLTTTKQNKCYVNFSIENLNFKIGYFSDRIDALNNIPKELLYIESNRISRIDTWKNMNKYKYVISPFGAGLDCHRTWEAIIFDCIPIVKRSELSTIYEGLPVLIVDKWSDINQKILDDFKPNYYNIKKIFMEYWIEIFNSYNNN